MNVRKRGLALLMCICMIFTLLPFSVLADNGGTILLSTASIALTATGRKIKILMIQQRIHYLAKTRLL